MVIKIAIVGAEESKWTEEQKKKAKRIIRQILQGALNSSQLFYPDEIILISGHCPKGGVDIWAEEIAKELGIKTEIYEPEVNQWEDEKIIEHRIGFMRVYKIRKGYKSRNIEIAKTCDVLYDIEPAYSCRYCLGQGYLTKSVKGLLSPVTEKCSKCEGDGAYSGGTWTLKYARKLGKEVYKVIIQ